MQLKPRYATFNARTAAVLTNLYVTGPVIGVSPTTSQVLASTQRLEEFNYFALDIAFTLGSLTNVGIKVEFSEDSVNWYQPVTTSNSGGTSTLTQMQILINLSGNYWVPLNGLWNTGGNFLTKYVRVSANGVGTVTSSSLAITLVAGWV